MAEENVRYFVLIYIATEFSRELCSSDEGEVRWIQKADFLKEKLAHGMDKVFEIIEGGEFTECFLIWEDGWKRFDVVIVGIVIAVN